MLNWTNGLPAFDNNAAIPTEPPGDFLPVINQDITFNFSVTNANILTILANVSNEGTFTNYEDGSVIIDGSFHNLTLTDNDGELLISGEIINSGELDNSGILNIESADTFLNEESGLFYNYGQVKLVDTYFANRGVFHIFGERFESNGEVENFGSVINNGNIDIQPCGIFKNYGSINNQYVIRNFNIFYNEGNYSGSPIIEELTLKNNSGLITANHECADNDGWTHYSDSTEGKILLSIYTNGQDIGNLADQSLTIQLSNDSRLGTGSVSSLSNALYPDCDDWYLFNRAWVIKSNNQNSAPFKIRLYFNESEYGDIQHTFPLSQNSAELFFYKLSGTEDAYASDVPPSGAHIFEPGSQSSQSSWLLSKISSGDFAEFEVTDLTGAYSAGVKSWLGGNIPFLLSFEATSDVDNQSVDIEWSTRQEPMSQEYILQRSLDSLNFTDIKTINATGNSSGLSVYNETDNNQDILATNFYRLKLIQTDGSIRYSPTRKVDFPSGNGEVTIFPNPSTNELYLQLSDVENGEVNIQIFDIDGQLRYADDFEIINNITVDNIYDKINLGSGIYSLQVKGLFRSETYRFIKIAR